MDRDRSQWETWITRIPKEESERLMQLSKILVKYKYISKIDRYNVGRWALHHVLEKLEVELENIKKEKATVKSPQ